VNSLVVNYDELNRILEKVFPNGDKLEYNWDGPRLCQIAKRAYSNDDTSEVVDFVRYSHDGVNRAVTVETMDGGNTRYDFNANGQVKSVHSRDCQPRDYTYDEDGNLTKVRINDDTNKEYDFEVDDRGWRTKITYPNGWYVEYQHNDAGQITALFLRDSQDALKHLMGYSYNNLSLVSQEDTRDFVASWTIEKIISRDDVGRVSEEDRNTTEGTFGTDYDLEYTYDANGNLTRIHNTDGGGEDYNMEFDALNRLVRYYEDTAGEKEIFSYNCAGLLAAREEDGDITKFGYDIYSVLDMITKANGDELGFDFDILGRLRRYGTDSRESTFNYDATKRFGDFYDGWKRYHWCKSQFLGYEDDANTFYVVLGAMGSVKVIFDHTQGIVNRLDYDRLGNLRNSDTTPQIELLFKKSYYNSDTDLYIGEKGVYDPKFGDYLIPGYNPPTGGGLCDHSGGGAGGGGGGTWTWGNCESSALGWYARYHFNWSDVFDWAADWMEAHPTLVDIVEIGGIAIGSGAVTGGAGGIGWLGGVLVGFLTGTGEYVYETYVGNPSVDWHRWLSRLSQNTGEYICDHL
jgi:YD repeat-containing protein